MEWDRTRPGHPPLLVLLLLSLLLLSATVSADFTAQCPDGCNCLYAGGKKKADCKDWSGSGLPVGLSTEIQVLDLRGAAVPELGPDALQKAGLENLRRLLLAGTGLSRLDRHAFRGLHLLVELDLADNQLTSIDTETFSDNGKLRQLSLSGNRLQKLNDLQFPELPNIQQLNLSHCQLVNISPLAFKKLTNLTTLNLDGNKLAVLDPVIFQLLTNLNSLTLGDNPWLCDCHMRPFRDWLVKKKLYQRDTKCVEPERLVGELWDVTRSEEFACRPQITIPEPTVVADIGQDVTLRCQISGDPAADTKWALNGGRILHNKPVPGTGRVYIIHEEGDVNRWTNLTVTRVREQDAGQYLCVGSNPGGEVRQNVTLVIGTAAPGATGGLPRDPVLVGAVAGGAALLLLLILLVFCWCCWRRRRRQSDKQRTTTSDPLANGDGYEKLSQTERQTDVLLMSPSDGSVTESPPTWAGAAADTVDGRRGYPELLHSSQPAQPWMEAPQAWPPRQRYLLTQRSQRPAYVTLPRRPHYGSMPAVGGPVYDSLGPRTTVDGSSRLSLASVGQEQPPVGYPPMEGPQGATLPRAAHGYSSYSGLPYSSFVRSPNADKIEPLTEEPEEMEEPLPTPPPTPPQVDGDAPLSTWPRPPSPVKPRKVAPPVAPKPKPRPHSVGTFLREEGVEGTEV